MKAILRRAYGQPEILDVDKPVPAEGEVLIRVHAASVNPYDWHQMTGIPYLMRIGGPKSLALGLDVAGEVETVGAGVTRFRPGDRVFGMKAGSFAEYLCAHEDRLAPVPAHLTFEQAAAVPLAALTALQGLRDKGGLQPGQKVLVNGASGGVGTFAVQLAKALGAHVTAVCSTRNVDLAKSLGADHVIDYTRSDFVRSGQRFDLILDVVGNRSVAARHRVLTPSGTAVVISGPKTNRLFGPMTSMFVIMLRRRLGMRRTVGMLTGISKDDLAFLAELLGTGAVVPVIERTYRLHEVPEALRHIGQGHAQGKLVITL